MFGSRTLWNDLLAHGLVGEIHLTVGAVVLGTGTPAFDRPPAVPLRLIDARVRDGSGKVLVRYDVTGPRGTQ
jgi:dihydrofolate reductase